MEKSALIVYGGWEGHEPEAVGLLFQEILEGEGYRVTRSATLDSFLDPNLTSFDLIVPVWTMGEITPDQSKCVTAAVAKGVGLAGCHGGMCDAFRADTEWQFMTGGQWVAHPGNDSVSYDIHFVHPHPLTEGLEDFSVTSEQYYLHVDPGVTVLATTNFPAPGVDGPHTNNPCRMPQIWTKQYGEGRVFYSALGHNRAVINTGAARETLRRGCLWATR